MQALIRHFNIRIIGRVQGVYFRASAREAAFNNGVKGFVRNEPDGSVYIEAEGEEKALQEFLFWCRQGPSRAQVEEVQFTTGEMIHFSSFEIRR
jgi:acylphosphatase